MKDERREERDGGDWNSPSWKPPEPAAPPAPEEGAETADGAAESPLKSANLYVVLGVSLVMIQVAVIIFGSPRVDLEPSISVEGGAKDSTTVHRLAELGVLDSLFNCSEEAQRIHGPVKVETRYKVTLSPEGVVRRAGPVFTNIHSGQMEAWQAFEVCAEKRILSRTFYPLGGDADFEVVVYFENLE